MVYIFYTVDCDFGAVRSQHILTKPMPNGIHLATLTIYIARLLQCTNEIRIK